MIQKIDKWGNSLGLRLPKTITERLSLNEGSTLVITIEKESLVLRPQKKYYRSLDELLDQISPKNIHSPLDWGKPQGNEVW